MSEASDAVNDSLHPMEKFTQRLVDATATGDVSYRHRDAAKLWSAIPQANSPHIMPPTMEKAQFLAQQQELLGTDPDLETIGAGAIPGTFVELRRNRIVTHGIVLRFQVLEGRKHSYTLTFAGEVWPHLINDITYTIPNFVSQDLLERAGDGYMATTIAQTTARLQMVEQIRAFTRQHERHFNSISKGIHPLYEQVRNQDPDKWADVTTPEVAKFMRVDVRTPPPVVTLFAIHAHLMARPLYYVADSRTHRSSHRFAVRPLSHVQAIQQVDNWVRTRDPAFESFVESARAVITKSREVQQKSWGAPPSQLGIKFDPWSSSDLIFIRYLQNALRTIRATQEDPYERATPSLIKAINMYPGHSFTIGQSQLLLTELGVLAPWDDVVTRTPELSLDIAPQGHSRESQTTEEVVQHILKKPDAPIPPILQQKLRDVHFHGSTELLQNDPNDAQRHDFGDLPVYIVDDAKAQELDDGLSIEAVPGEPGNYWIHVHIADPTAKLPSGHVLDLQARKLVTTFYSSHRTWPMLPSALTMSLFSLGTKSGSNGQRVLTFSLKMTEMGEFLDYDVKAGFVRNMQIMTYDQVDRLLGLESSFYRYPIGGSPPPPKPLPEKHRPDLQKLRDITLRYFHRILNMNPIINFTFPLAKVAFREALPSSPLLPPAPIIYKGFPNTTYFVENQEESALSFRQSVAECMKLAGRAASRFCRDRGIPALRRSSLFQVTTPADRDYLISLRGADTGYVDPFECIKCNLYAPPGEATLELREHWGIGIREGEGYCRVTSPLRRYADLLMHWQIKHALIPGNTRPFFSTEYLTPLLQPQYEKEKVSTTAERIYNRHWSLAYLDRHIQGEKRKHGGDYNPFPNLIARTTGSPGFDTLLAMTQVPVIIPSLGVQGELKGIESNENLPVGTSIPVKIKDFKMGIPLVLQLEPV